MRPRPTPVLLLALLLFAVPLALLAWVGARALQRSGSQASAAVFRRGMDFLRSANRTLQVRLGRYLDELASRAGQELQDRYPVVAARRLAEADGYPELLDLLLIGENGSLRFPRPPPAADLALHRPLRGLAAAAAVLTEAGQFERAASLLEDLVRRLSAPRRRRGTARGQVLFQEAHARFSLATCLRRLGRQEAAAAELQAVLELRQEALANLQDGPPWAELALLARLAGAEDTGIGPRLSVLEEIATGQHDGASESLLQAAVRRLVAGIPAEAAERPRAEDLMRTEEVRRQGRAFAAGQGAALERALGPDLRRDAATIHHLVREPDGVSLLVLRPAGDRVRRRHGATWLGLRLDLTALLVQALGPYLHPQGRNFSLAVRDLRGAPVLAEDPALPEGLDVPALPTPYGLQLLAVPVDAQELIAAERAAARDTLLLAAGLAAAALGGAFVLWRSARREVELAALKVDLVSRVSHDLKTPLALIRMYAETLHLGRARDPAEVARFAGIVAREADRLGLWVERILDLSRHQAGTLTYEPSEEDLGRRLAEIVAAYRPQVEARGGRLEERIASGVRARVDAAAFEGAIVNLLENAVKYGLEDGDRSIEVRLAAADGQAILEVADRGIGVPEADRQRIFGLFQRGSNAGEARGAGLGLSLVQHFAQGHGGTVQALPREGGGSIFRLSLPLAGGSP